MWTEGRQSHLPFSATIADQSIASYSVLGSPVVVISDIPEVLDRVDETYIAFRQEAASLDGALVVGLLRQSGGTYLVYDSDGYRQDWPDVPTALLKLLGQIVQGVLARLHARGMYAIHAGAVVHHGAALIIAGTSGQGKTTLVLGLLRRGLGLLSDELAIVDPDTQHIWPYRRSLHIRPGTPELIPELAFLHQRPRHQLGGGIEWALAPAELDRALPGSLACAAPLRSVLLLDGAPRPDGPPAIASVPAALATMELLRGTWAASVDFAAGLARIGRLMDGVACARLRAGALDATLDAVMSWLESRNG